LEVEERSAGSGSAEVGWKAFFPLEYRMLARETHWYNDAARPEDIQMPLSPGAQLGPYEIIDAIGAGGMGEVYKARDRRLDRIVAIKVSRDQFTERFEREARAIAALNHPNICTLHDVGPNYLVMELVEGQTLAERIQQGAIPLDESMRIADQIAAALEAAHEKTIVHRDLKPGNVKIKPDGGVKVLDFGLAKVGGGPTAPTDYSPTISAAATQAGVILGTAAYMSPEQARGKAVDQRADIWSFGVVLYEMLTGERLFRGEDLTEVLASVVKERPDLDRIPPRVRRLLEECLQKDPGKRLQSIGDRRYLLDRVETPPEPARRPTGWIWPAVAAVFALTAAVAFWWASRPAPTAPVVRFEINAPLKATFTNWMSLSPDGRQVAFTARHESGIRLWVRNVDALEAKDIADTGTNPVPFWSADSKYIAYQFEGKLRRVEAAGGPSQILCDASTTFMGGAWNRNGVIIFGGPDGLQRVLANGGASEKLTILSASGAETGHSAPVFLPDGVHFLYQRRSSKTDTAGIYEGSLDVAPEKQSTKLLLATDLNALFVPSPGGGKLLFLRENALMAQPFDVGKSEVSGEAVQVANPVGRMNGLFINAGVSENGSLIYRTGGLAEIRRLVWYDRAGKVLESLAEPGVWNQIAVSPDGRRAAVTRAGEVGTQSSVFVVDLMKSLFTRFTFDKSRNADAVWSPDGSKIVFSSERDGVRNLYIKSSNGAANEDSLLKSSVEKTPTDWSRDGRWLLFTVRDPKNSTDIWVLPMTITATANAKAEADKPMPFLSTPVAEDQARFSPDGRFVAYRSTESGRSEVYVRTFPDPTGRWQVSRNGAQSPSWRGDGKELFFNDNSLSLVASDVTLTPAVEFGVPHKLFSAKYTNIGAPRADGQRFLWADTLDEQASNAIIVVLNALK